MFKMQLVVEITSLISKSSFAVIIGRFFLSKFGYFLKSEPPHIMLRSVILIWRIQRTSIYLKSIALIARSALFHPLSHKLHSVKFRPARHIALFRLIALGRFGRFVYLAVADHMRAAKARSS